jgi:hypothetical protein
MRQYLLFLLLLLPYYFSAQSHNELRGRVMAGDTLPLSGVHIQNLYTKQVTTTSADGYFTIKAAVNQTLQFTHVSMQTAYHTVSKADFQFSGLLVKMKESVTELSEVEVSKYKKITAQELGILQHTPQEMTYNEKRLSSSRGSILGVDWVINSLTGHRKMLKQIVVNDRNRAVANYILDHKYDFMQKELKLSDEDCAILAYYVMDKPEFHAAIEKKEDKKLEFLLIEAWGEYQRKSSEK